MCDKRLNDKFLYYYHLHLSESRFKDQSIPLSPLFVVSTIDMWESRKWLGKNILWSTV